MNNTDIEILLGLTEILKNHKTYTGEDYRVYNALDRVFNAEQWITKYDKQGKPYKVKIDEKPENYNIEKKLAAWNILSKGTGKSVKWLRMNYKKYSELIQMLIREPDDKLTVTSLLDDRETTNYYPDLLKLNYKNNDDDSNGAEAAKILERVYDDLLNDNFTDSEDYITKHQDDKAKYLAEQEIKEVKKKIKSDYIKNIFKKSDKITEKTFDKIAKDLINFSSEEQLKIIDDMDILENIINIPLK